MVLYSGDKNADPKENGKHGDFLHFKLMKVGENSKRKDEQTVCSPPFSSITDYGFRRTSPLIIISIYYSVIIFALRGITYSKD